MSEKDEMFQGKRLIKKSRVKPYNPNVLPVEVDYEERRLDVYHPKRKMTVRPTGISKNYNLERSNS